VQPPECRKDEGEIPGQLRSVDQCAGTLAFVGEVLEEFEPFAPVEIP
jgi:hypothetical protein